MGETKLLFRNGFIYFGEVQVHLFPLNSYLCLLHSFMEHEDLDFLKSGSMPQWEKDFMLTKYHITTEAYEKSQAALEAMK